MLTAEQINALTLHDVNWILEIFKDRILVWNRGSGELTEVQEIRINGTAIQITTGFDLASDIGPVDAKLWAESEETHQDENEFENRWRNYLMGL